MATRITIKTDERRVVRLLRSRTTQQYLNHNGWTDDPDEATSFSNPVEAVEICTKRGLVDVELALRMPGGCDVFSTTIR
jgi:hypothetical protein